MDSSDSLHGKEPRLRPPPIWVSDSLFGLSENSSSGLSTPFGSVGSTRTETESDDEDDGDDEEFLAELTRQMAGFTLQDEVDDFDPNILVQDHENITLTPQEYSPKSNEVYSMKDQSMTRKQSSTAAQGRRVGKTESTHQHGGAEAAKKGKGGRRRGGHGGGGRVAPRNGSGMQAVFLSRSGYEPGGSSSGTGVFLPRGCNYHGQSESKKKSEGCSTVLIPKRVLQALQIHFSNMDSTKSQSNRLSQIASWNKTEDSPSRKEQRSDIETQPATNDQELPELPQEWTY